MFEIDVYNNIKPLNIYLLNVNDDIIGCINEIIEESSATLKYGFTQQYELNFDVVDTEENKNWYNFLHEGMYLFVESIGYFKMNQPTITNDGQIERKSISAFSIESELEDKTHEFSVNMGTKDSLEYLVEYEDGEDEELLNPYTGVPYDWIVLYNTFPEQLDILKTKVNNGYYGQPDVHNEIVVTDTDKINELSDIFNLIPRLRCKITYTDNQDGSKDSVLTEYVIVEYDTTNIEVIVSYTLTDEFVDRIDDLITFYTKYKNQLSLLSLVLDKTGWNVGNIFGIDDNDYNLCNKKFQFEINETAYSFLTQTFSKTSECIVIFDKFNRLVNITPVADFGNDTGIIIGYNTLVNKLDITTNEEKVSSRLYVTGGNDLDITRVNFGKEYIDNLLYKINLKEGNTKIYVPNYLSNKYLFYTGYVESKRSQYINLSKQYEENLLTINELKYRVPNDDLKTDWGTFSLDELKTSLTHYKNLLVTLTSLYKEDYGQLGLNNDGSININYIKTTPYWWDYEAYTNIIVEIQCAIEVFPYYNDITKWTSSQKAQYEQAIKAWETEWTLYGIVELEAKIASYEQNMNILLDKGDTTTDKSAVIKKNDGSDWGIKSWSELTDDEKAMYGFSTLLYRYDTYMEYYNNMVSAKTYLATLKTQLDTLETQQETIQTQLNTIKEQVKYEYYFTADECKIIYRLIRDSDYSNDNIFFTNIDTVSEKYNRMVELLDDGKEQLSIFSRPQIKFSISAENLLGLPEFEPMWDSFVPGNYIYVQYRNNDYVKLRLVSYTFNPCLPSSNNLEIEFSNFILSRSAYNDWASLLGNGSSSGSRRSSGGGGSGSSYGDMDDVDVTISNTMLSKLLNSETFGTRVTDVILDTIDVNKITARLATFGGLANGTTKVDGKCITTGYIIDANYNGTDGGIDNTAGSVINLETGKFSFAGGKLKYDIDSVSGVGTLTVQGTIKADAGEIGDFKLANGALYTGQKSTDGTNVAGIRISQNEICLSNGTADSTIKLAKGIFTVGDKLTYDTTNGLVVIGSITATSGIIGGFQIGFENNAYLMRAETTETNNGNTIIHQYAFQAPDINGNTSNAFYIREKTNNNNWIYPFRVRYDGYLQASRANIGNWNIIVDDPTKSDSSGTIMRDVTTENNYIYRTYLQVPDLDAKYHTEVTDNILGSRKRPINSNTWEQTVAISCEGELYLHSTDDYTVTIGSNGYGLYINNLNNQFEYGISINGCTTNDGSINIYPKYITYYSNKNFTGTECSISLESWSTDEGSNYTGLEFDCPVHLFDKAFFCNASASIFIGNPGSYTNVPIFRPEISGEGTLGSGGFRWGDIYTVNAVNVASDRKMKNHIKYLYDIHEIEDFVYGLRPALFTLKNGSRNHMGLYAQDVSQIANNTIGDVSLFSAIVLREDENGNVIEEYFDDSVDDSRLNWSLKYSEFIAPMIVVIQKQKQKIDELENRVSILENN